MDNKELLDYRVKLFEDAVRFRKPDRTPHTGNYFTWIVLDSGFKLGETFSDFDKYLEAYNRFLKKYRFDMLSYTALRNPVNILGDLGASQYIVDDAKGTINIKDNPVMDFDDYRVLIDDFTKFLWTAVLPKRASNFNKDSTIAQFRSGFDEFNKISKFNQDLPNLMAEDYGMPAGMGTLPAILPGIEYLFNFFRGIKGLSSDMRKDPGLVKEAVEALDRMFVDPGLAAMKDYVKPESHPFDYMSAMLVNNILNIKQWDEFYWPSLKKMMDAVVEADKTMVFYSEGSTKRFWDYFKDYPKGHFAFYIEQDDVYEFREALPNMCAIGGMPTTLLGTGTPKECVDYAKRLIDDLGGEGGFILTQDKMVSYKNDTNPENLVAVCDFVQEYR